jgi:hypothetical protein
MWSVLLALGYRTEETEEVDTAGHGARALPTREMMGRDVTSA